jgi:hypothetical protein
VGGDVSAHPDGKLGPYTLAALAAHHDPTIEVEVPNPEGNSALATVVEERKEEANAEAEEAEQEKKEEKSPYEDLREIEDGHYHGEPRVHQGKKQKYALGVGWVAADKFPKHGDERGEGDKKEKYAIGVGWVRELESFPKHGDEMELVDGRVKYVDGVGWVQVPSEGGDVHGDESEDGKKKYAAGVGWVPVEEFPSHGDERGEGEDKEKYVLGEGWVGADKFPKPGDVRKKDDKTNEKYVEGIGWVAIPKKKKKKAEKPIVDEAEKNPTKAVALRLVCAKMGLNKKVYEPRIFGELMSRVTDEPDERTVKIALAFMGKSFLTKDELRTILNIDKKGKKKKSKPAPKSTAGTPEENPKAAALRRVCAMMGLNHKIYEPRIFNELMSRVTDEPDERTVRIALAYMGKGFLTKDELRTIFNIDKKKKKKKDKPEPAGPVGPTEPAGPVGPVGPTGPNT